MLGVVFHNQGKFGKALDAFQEALRINPAYTEACLNLAVTYNDLGMYVEARAIYARAQKSTNDDSGKIQDAFVRGKLANMHLDLGEVYAGLQCWDEAILEFRKALALRSDFADIRTALGKALRESGRRDEALAELLEAKKLRPRFASGIVQLGLTYYTMGRKDEALSEWRSVLEFDPDNSTARMYVKLVNEMEKKA
jgi:tetratricopeptide (TPR) repeat protein